MRSSRSPARWTTPRFARRSSTSWTSLATTMAASARSSSVSPGTRRGPSTRTLAVVARRVPACATRTTPKRDGAPTRASTSLARAWRRSRSSSRRSPTRTCGRSPAPLRSRRWAAQSSSGVRAAATWTCLATASPMGSCPMRMAVARTRRTTSVTFSTAWASTTRRLWRSAAHTPSAAATPTAAASGARGLARQLRSRTSTFACSWRRPGLRRQLTRGRSGAARSSSRTRRLARTS
mmetsp:Transcript_16254/g.41243  ORF Transcript_16254/g.41243 Transcript_16254/m.41243 type:complete len:236 (+) Transcript_16254:417-1124(+)